MVCTLPDNCQSGNRPPILPVHFVIITWRVCSAFRGSPARAALLFSLPVAFASDSFWRPIIQVIYGDAYIGSVALPLAILAMGQLVNVIFGSVGMFLTMAGFEKDTLVWTDHGVGLLML